MSAAAHATRPVPVDDPLFAAWRNGAAAFARGELPPADPDEAEGWYFTENAATRLGLVPRIERTELRAVAGGWPAAARWALPRIFVGTAAFAALLLALAILPGVR